MDDLFQRIQNRLAEYSNSDSSDSATLISDLKTEYDNSTRLDRGDNLVPDDAKHVKEKAVYYDNKKMNYEVNYNWPADDGFVSSTKQPIEMKKGFRFDRLGSYWGSFVSPIHEDKITDYNGRSLPYYFKENAVSDEPAYHRYEVAQDFSQLITRLKQKASDIKYRKYYIKYCVGSQTPTTIIGKTAPCFDKSGGEDQIMLPMPIDLLLGLGLIK